MPIADDVNLEDVAHNPRTEGFSGADLAALMREGAMCALRIDLNLEKASVFLLP